MPNDLSEANHGKRLILESVNEAKPTAAIRQNVGRLDGLLTPVEPSEHWRQVSF